MKWPSACRRCGPGSKLVMLASPVRVRVARSPDPFDYEITAIDDPADPAGWTQPSAREKTVVQRNVIALLDELAPERVLARGDRVRQPIEQHRTPTGCVLQAATAALSVSWFPDANRDAPQGELHVVVWRGIVSRRGAPPPRDGATIVREFVFYPIVPPSGQSVWRTRDGGEYDTATLAAKCLAALEEQITNPAST
jgi:hypothetical protein